MALKFTEEVFRGLMRDLIDHKDNIGSTYDQVWHWVVNNFKKYNKGQFSINKEIALKDFTRLCVNYSNLVNAFVTKNVAIAEYSLLQIIDVFGLSLSLIDEYLNLLFTPEEKAN